MKRILTYTLTLALMALLKVSTVQAQIKFMYQGREIKTSPRCLYVSDDRKTSEKKHVFGHVSEALRYAERNNDSRDTTYIYIEPSVYWLDNPDDKEVRRPRTGNIPYAMELTLDNVRLVGLSAKPEDVVLAVNRGQTQGADGNYTMLHIKGGNITAENITFGNYCNVDLVYERDKSKNRKKRKDAIVQAQIAICDGDNYVLRNCRFISRLNLCPFVGAKHTEFYDCYFECTDDALCGTGVYNHCRFTFYSGKPFYTTDREVGAHFVDCDIYSKTHGTQYLTKVSGPVTMKNCRWTSDDQGLRIEWDKRPDPRNYCVMTDCTLNGKPLNVPTPTEPLPVSLPPFYIQPQLDVVPGQWTIDCHKPLDTAEYPWQPDNTKAAWAYAEGVDGAENQWGMVQVQKGARLMFTPKTSEPTKKQECVVALDPCKSAGQGFGSATGQYLDICIKFDTKTLTGYGLRFVRTPDYDHAVETVLVEYVNGKVAPICEPQRCDLFKKGCVVRLNAEGKTLKAQIEQGGETQQMDAEMPHPNDFGGFHLQHTGSTGASATVIRSIKIK